MHLLCQSIFTPLQLENFGIYIAHRVDGEVRTKQFMLYRFNITTKTSMSMKTLILPAVFLLV